MMNALAIALALTSLLAAAVWSPSSSTHHVDDHREVIVKEGHRVVVVEYDKEADGSTKVLISPPDTDVPEEEKPASEGVFSGPRELVCDAYGKCKHKIASAFGKTKDKAEEMEEHVKEAVTGHSIGESLGKAKDTVAHGIDKAKEVAGDVADTVKGGAVKAKNKLDVVGSAKTLGGDIERNVTGIGKIQEAARETVESVHEAARGTVGSVQEVGEKSLGEILKKLKEVANDVVWYFVSRDKFNAVVGLIHMLGYSTAYGMCVWVTFISSYILGRCLPKQQFGIVQSRIYPVYFKAMAYCISAALLAHLASKKTDIGSQGLSLVSALLLVLTNLFVLDPRATKTMYERMKIEKEEGRGVDSPTRDGTIGPDGLPERGSATAAVVRPGRTYRDTLVDNGDANVVRPVVAERQDMMRLNEKLKRLNTYSSMVNGLTLVALTWHMAYMGRRLHATR